MLKFYVVASMSEKMEAQHLVQNQVVGGNGAMTQRLGSKPAGPTDNMGLSKLRTDPL